MSQKIYKAINDVMSAVGYVQKTGTNSFHGYKFAGEAAVIAALRDEMVKNGLILLPRVESERGPDEHGISHVTIHYDLAHTSGEVIKDAVVMCGQGGDKNTKGVGDKGIYKAITGCNKYAFLKLFHLETGDDPEASTAPNEDANSASGKEAETKAKPTVQFRDKQTKQPIKVGEEVEF